MKPSARTVLVEKRSPDQWIFYGLLLLLIWMPLPWGSNTEMSAAALGLCAEILLAFWLILAIFGAVALPSRWPATVWASLFIWVLWLLWIFLQTIPCAPLHLEHYSPDAAAIYGKLAALADGKTYASISIARGLTVSGLISSLGYFALYLLVLLTVNTRQRVKLLLWTLALCGLFQAFYGLHMTITGMEYGFLEKKIFNVGRASGTFVNPDHYAAYLELTLAAGIGIVLTDIGRWDTRNWKSVLQDFISFLFSSKFRARTMLIVMVAALILTRSRMGNVAFFVALTTCGMLFTLIRYRRWFLPSLLLFSSLLVIDIMVVSQWFGLDAVVQRIEKTDLATEQRMILLEDLNPVITAYSLTGSGLGTFALAYSPYRKERMKSYFDHAHNEYAEFLIETGVIGVVLLGLLLFTHVLHCVRIMVSRKTPIYSAAAFSSLMAILAMSFHSVAEFMLRIPAVAMTFVTLMALGISISTQSRASNPQDKPELVQPA